MELKTLNDLEVKSLYVENSIELGVLKKEAIKWVKNWGKGTGHDAENLSFMEFFNITEEDLK